MYLSFLNRKWFAVALVGVLTPVFLLTAFKLGGVMPQFQRPETILVEAVKSNITRPLQVKTFAKWVENNYSNNIISVKLKVAIGTYHHADDSTYAPYEWLSLKIVAEANTTQGFIHSMIVRFSQMDEDAYLNLIYDEDIIELLGLYLEKMTDGYGHKEGVAVARAKNQPNNCLFTFNSDWVFFDKKDHNHTFTATLETIVYNKTAYQKILLPIQIGVLAP